MTEERDLTDDETYSALLEIMRDTGLNWVAEEVEDAVQAGDVEVRDAPRQTAGRNRDLEVPELRGIPSLEVIRSEFGPRDRVGLAVAALRRVVIETAEMEADIRDEFGAQVSFIDDEEGSEARVLVRVQTASEAHSLQRLSRLLSELEAGG
jgi:hypothetical protein